MVHVPLVHNIMLMVLILYFLPPSGPPSCLCSKTEQCEVTGDNELEVVPNVTRVRGQRSSETKSSQVIVQEEDCQELCATNPQCGYYTWSVISPLKSIDKQILRV